MSKHPVIWLIVLMSVLLPGKSIAADEAKAALIDGGGFDCLPVSVFGLSGIRLWQPEESVEEKLGKPETITEGWGEDDGGRYTVHTYQYSLLEVDIVRGQVDRIYTDSPKISMPSGVKVGHRMDEVIRIFGRKPRDWRGKGLVFHIVTCPENDE